MAAAPAAEMEALPIKSAKRSILSIGIIARLNSDAGCGLLAIGANIIGSGGQYRDYRIRAAMRPPMAAAAPPTKNKAE